LWGRVESKPWGFGNATKAVLLENKPRLVRLVS
jgi:hypothetical protein